MSHETFSYSPNSTKDELKLLSEDGFDPSLKNELKFSPEDELKLLPKDEPKLSSELLAELKSSPQICEPLVKINDIYTDYLDGCAWDLASLLRLQLDSESLDQTSLFFSRHSSNNPSCRIISNSVKLIGRTIRSEECLIPGHLETMLKFLTQEPLFKRLCNR